MIAQGGNRNNSILMRWGLCTCRRAVCCAFALPYSGVVDHVRSIVIASSAKASLLRCNYPPTCADYCGCSRSCCSWNVRIGRCLAVRSLRACAKGSSNRIEVSSLTFWLLGRTSVGARVDHQPLREAMMCNPLSSDCQHQRIITKQPRLLSTK